MSERRRSRRPLLALLTGFALTASLVPTVDAWDFVYGDPGPANYSEYHDVALGPDGSTYIVGLFSGEFRGLSSPDSYQYFVEKITPSGAVAWTTPLDVGYSVTTVEEYPTSIVATDSTGHTYVVLQQRMMFSVDAAGVLVATRSVASTPRLTTARLGGIVVTTERTAALLGPDLQPQWSVELAGAGYDFNTPITGSDGTIWVVGPALTLPTQARATALYRLSAEGTIITSVKYYGDDYAPNDWRARVVLGASADYLWLNLPRCITAVQTTDGSRIGCVNEELFPAAGGDSPFYCQHYPELSEFVMNGSRVVSLGYCLEPSTVPGLLVPETNFYLTERTFSGPLASNLTTVVRERVRSEDGGSPRVAIGANEFGEWAVVGSTPGTPLFATSSPSTASVPVRSSGDKVTVSTTTTRAVAAKDPLGSLYFGRRAAGSTLEVKVAGRYGVPAGSKAASLTVTALNPQAAGSLTVFPCASSAPATSTLNFAAGETTSNSVLSALTRDGKVCIRTSAATHLTVDVNGEAGAGSDLATYRPARFLDTRPTGNTFDDTGEKAGLRAAGSITRVRVAGRGRVTADATAAVINITAVGPASSGWVTAYSCGSTMPTSPTLTTSTGRSTATMAIVAPGTSGEICIHTTTATNLIVDVNGHARPGSNLLPIRAARLLDTRPTGATIDGTSAQIGRRSAGSTTSVKVTGRGPLPTTLESAVLTISVINPTAAGTLKVYACGTTTPTAINISYPASRTTTISTITGLSATGTACVTTSQATDLTIAATAYNTPGTTLDSHTPTRIANTTR